MKKGLAITFSVLAVAALTLGILTSGAPATVVSTAVVTVGDFERTAEVSGEAGAGEMFIAMPATSGRVSRVYVAEGQKVKKGDRLFTFDETDVQNALKQAQYELDAALAAQSGLAADAALAGGIASDIYIEQEAAEVMAQAPMLESVEAARQAASLAQGYEQLMQTVIAQAQNEGVDLGVLNKAVEAMALIRQTQAEAQPDDAPADDAGTEQAALEGIMESGGEAAPDGIMESAGEAALAGILGGDVEPALEGIMESAGDAALTGAMEEAALVSAAEAQTLEEAQTERTEALAAGVPDSPEIVLYREKVRQAEEALNRLTMTSTMDGEVLGVALREGEIAAAGSGAVVIGDTDRMLVNLRVPEYELKNVQVGQNVRLNSNGLTGTGKVTKRGAALASGSYGEIYGNVEVEPEAGFAPLTGASVDAEIILSKSLDTLYVPRECVITEDDGSNYVFACEEGKANKKPVATGLESDFFIELLSGVVAGEVLIIAPFDMMDGSAISIEM